MKPNSDAPVSSKILDIFKWLIVFSLLTTAVVGNHILSDVSVVIRAISVAVLSLISLVLFAFTTKGKAAVVFFNEAKIELRKIVWPTRQETMQTTLVVLVVCLIMTVILWFLDLVMVKLIALITGV